MSETPKKPDWKNAKSWDQPHFAFWMSALTSEGLHAKADIARLLAMLTQALSAAEQRIEDEVAHGKQLERGLGKAIERSEQAEQRAEGMRNEAGRIHAALTTANECGLITDTLWMLEGNETVFDAVAALASVAVDSSERGR